MAPDMGGRQGDAPFAAWCHDGVQRGLIAWTTGIAAAEATWTLTHRELALGALWVLIVMAHIQVLAVLRAHRQTGEPPGFA